jgi:lysyl-tRNA synthetase class 2
MTTLTHRNQGPDKKAAEMSDSDEAGHASRADLPARRGGSSRNAAEPGNFAERSRHRTWVPRGAALLTALIGLSDIVAVFKPEWPHKLHSMVPGTLSNVTRSADVLIGLMLLMLAHGLRRRKHRAWQAVTALLAFDVGIHLLHPQRIVTTAVAIALLVALVYFHDEFYAEGDPRTRWRALWVFACLAVADGVIGLSYLLAASGCRRWSTAWSGSPGPLSSCPRHEATSSTS